MLSVQLHFEPSPFYKKRDNFKGECPYGATCFGSQNVVLKAPGIFGHKIEVFYVKNGTWMYALSTLSVSPSCLRISNLPAESVVSVLKHF